MKDIADCEGHIGHQPGTIEDNEAIRETYGNAYLGHVHGHNNG